MTKIFVSSNARYLDDDYKLCGVYLILTQCATLSGVLKLYKMERIVGTNDNYLELWFQCFSFWLTLPPKSFVSVLKGFLETMTFT